MPANLPTEWYEYILIGLAALAAGLVNALAGGGTLISFPALTAMGVPAVAANVTNTVALVPGYLGAAIAQMKQLEGHRERLWVYIPVGILGGVLGGVLLVNTSEETFRSLVPFLILFASALLAVSDPVKKWAQRRMAGARAQAGLTADPPSTRTGTWLAALPLGLAAVYGGYFGAGLGVILLAVLSLTLNDSLTELNALKQVISFFTNTAAALFFVFSGDVVWPVAMVMAVFALAGGALGGRLAGRIQPSTLRWVVVIVGVVVSIVYFIRG